MKRFFVGFFIFTALMVVLVPFFGFVLIPFFAVIQLLDVDPSNEGFMIGFYLPLVTLISLLLGYHISARFMGEAKKAQRKTKSLTKKRKISAWYLSLFHYAIVGIVWTIYSILVSLQCFHGGSSGFCDQPMLALAIPPAIPFLFIRILGQGMLVPSIFGVIASWLVATILIYASVPVIKKVVTYSTGSNKNKK